jgi:hypothetical protein
VAVKITCLERRSDNQGKVVACCVFSNSLGGRAWLRWADSITFGKNYALDCGAKCSESGILTSLILSATLRLGALSCKK